MDEKIKKKAGRPKKIDLSTDDICKIIAECRSANVAEITLDGLHVVFQAHRNESAPILGQGRDEQVVETVVSGPNAEEARLMNEQALLDAEDAQILIDDPLAFEKINSSQDIERLRVIQA